MHKTPIEKSPCDKNDNIDTVIQHFWQILASKVTAYLAWTHLCNVLTRTSTPVAICVNAFAPSAQAVWHISAELYDGKLTMDINI